MVPAINVEWSIIAGRIFSPDAEFWRALVTTVCIAVVAQVLGIALGLISALGGLSRLRPVRALAAAYVLVIRGTPLIVQIFFVFFGANLFFGFSLFPRAVAIAGLTLSGAILAGTVALAINEGAYMSEIIRAGIQSVDPGQMEAALSVGMTRSLAMRRIVLPQAARVIVPPLGNEFNGMIKNTSLLAFIGVYEMFFDAETSLLDDLQTGRVLPRRRVLVSGTDDDLEHHPGSYRAAARSGRARSEHRGPGAGASLAVGTSPLEFWTLRGNSE